MKQVAGSTQQAKFERGTEKLRESGSATEMRGGNVKSFWNLGSRRGGGGAVVRGRKGQWRFGLSFFESEIF
jgi:hypothetical protein